MLASGAGRAAKDGHKLTTITLPQPLPPLVELPPAQASLNAKDLHALIGSNL